MMESRGREGVLSEGAKKKGKRGIIVRETSLHYVSNEEN